MTCRPALTLALILLCALPATVSAQAPPDGPLPLAPGQERFWPGGQVDEGNVGDASLCDVVAPCPTFTLLVRSGGERLRVAYDTPSREDSFELQLISPSGTTTSVDGSNVFNAEAFAARPQAGSWTVRVIPKGATRAALRLRAKLERRTTKPAGRTPLLPNLRAVPPYEFGFAAPANPANAAYPPDTVNPPLSVAGAEPVSCAADELAPVAAGGGGAHDCLRLTTGPINAGDGPFLKTFAFAGDAAGQHLDNAPPYVRGQARQVIMYSDGTREERPAGKYSFHTTHAHFHDEGILTYELFRAVGDQLAPAGAGTKSGFCPADQLIGDWRAFAQDPAGDFGEGDAPTGSCYGAADDGMFALTRGWGDVYRYQRPGQYVEFGGNGDGLYVVRATVDKGGTTLETDETDNSSYALIRVVGRRIVPLERGRGTSHLDPHKIVFTGAGPASQDPYGGDLPTAAAQRPASGPRERGDRRAPRVTRIRVRGRTIRFRLSEPAGVTLSVLRGTRVVRRHRLRGRAGANAIRIARVRRGRYRLAFSVRDAAGNAATIRSRLVRLR